MKSRWARLFLVAAFLIVGRHSAVADEIRTITTDQLAALVKPGEKIKLVLKSGTYGEGRLEAVEAEGLKVNIRKSDNLNDLPQGLQAVAFGRLASVTVSRLKGKKRVWLPVILTGFAGTLWAAAESKGDLSGLGHGILAAWTGGAAVAGYFGGRAADRESLTFVIK